MMPFMRPLRAKTGRASRVRRSLADARPPRLDDTAALAPHIKAAMIGVGQELLRLSDAGFACAQHQYGVGCARRGELVEHGTAHLAGEIEKHVAAEADVERSEEHTSELQS